MTQDKRYHMMTESNLHRLIPKLAVPTIISMLVTSVYNTADTYFVSKISTEASAAVGIIFSLMALIQALGFAVGIGSSTYVSRLLGEKKQDDADKAVSTAFFLALALGTVFAAVGLTFCTPIVRLLGAIEEVEPYAVDYATYIFLGAPFMMGLYVLNNQMRAQGYALLSMIGILSGGILNIALDPLFIFTFGWGIKGAAIATVISQFLSFWILFFLNQYKKSTISVRFRTFRPSVPFFREMLRGGAPSLCRQGLASLSAVVLNYAAGPFGAVALSAMSIVNRIVQLINSVLIGFGQGFLPVCGFNFGAKRYDRVLDAYRFCIKVGVVLISVFGVITFFSAETVMTWFKADDAEVIEIGTAALRYQCFTLPLQAAMMLSQFLCQAIGYGTRASLIAMGRQGLFLIPLYWIFSRTIGVLGVQIAQPCSDVITAVMTFLLLRTVYKKLNDKAKSANR